MEQKFPARNYLLKISLHQLLLSSFLEILENAVPFVTGNFWKFKLAFLDEWKASQVFQLNSITQQTCMVLMIARKDQLA